MTGQSHIRLEGDAKDLQRITPVLGMKLDGGAMCADIGCSSTFSSVYLTVWII